MDGLPIRNSANSVVEWRAGILDFLVWGVHVLSENRPDRTRGGQIRGYMRTSDWSKTNDLQNGGGL